MAYLEARMNKEFMVLSKCFVGEIFESVYVVVTYGEKNDSGQNTKNRDEEVGNPAFYLVSQNYFVFMCRTG